MTDPIQPYDDPKTGDESAHPLSFDKFSEPRTMPAYWDLSELMAAPKPASQGVSEPDIQAESPTCPKLPSEQDGMDEPRPEWHRNLFPQPRTYPTHWDLNP